MKYLKISDSRDNIRDLCFNSQIYTPSVFFNTGGGNIIYDPHLETVDETEITITSENIPDTSGNPIAIMYNFIGNLDGYYVSYQRNGSSSNGTIIASWYLSGTSRYYRDIDGNDLFRIRFYEEGLNDRAYTSIGTATFVFKKLILNF